ncbi:RNA-directed DNA polymerase, eukaryota, reverse transcriptase zinc-binding domain protein [Tanacetum coccineum]
MISWIMSRLTSPSFTVNVNRDCYGYFKGMRGMRQGDPLSPYLFTLVMEVFLLMVKRKIEEDGAFKYHWRCDRLKLTHLSFADDLMVFSKADVHSVMILSKALKGFSGVLGMVPNLDKSLVFFGNVLEFLKSEILHVLPFAFGILLVSSLQVYWASTFILPKDVNAEIEQLMCGFLWSHAGFVTLWREVNGSSLRRGGHQFKDLVKLDFAPYTLSDIIVYLYGRLINRSILSILQRLVIGVMVYFIWQEQNLQRFQAKSRPVRDLCGIIRDNVRLKLMSLKIRKSVQVCWALGLWSG